MSGIVFDFQRFSLHDGPGIRTLVFLKGCPLRCRWCANPESQSARPQLWYQRDKCSYCLRCTASCPRGGEFASTREIPWEDCADCEMPCVELCLQGAKKKVGTRMGVDEVVAVLRRDKVFYANSGGGVTMGGGEMSMQPDFAADILAGCRAEGIHTAIETCGLSAWVDFERILRNVDLLLFDLKHMDSAAHREGTGVGNETILANIVKGARMVRETIVRLPLIPGFNDGEGNIERMGSFIRDELPSVRRIEILPYHSTGESKSECVGREYGCVGLPMNDDNSVQAIKAHLSRFVAEVSVGG
jgi:pyruvate formate lyase activating enzyme